MNALTILKRSVRVAIASIVGAAVVLVLLLFFFQGHMIYLRPTYNMEPSKLLGSAGELIRYESGGLPQTAYYVPPSGATPPPTAKDP